MGVTGFYFSFSCLLFHQTSIEELENGLIDDYRSTRLKGELVLKGHFYLRLDLHYMISTLNEKKVAICYAATVCHKCCELGNRRKGQLYTDSH